MPKKKSRIKIDDLPKGEKLEISEDDVKKIKGGALLTARTSSLRTSSLRSSDLLKSSIRASDIRLSDMLKTKG